ncbi:Hpt domain-containing protein [Luteimonas viscosa]|uniref:Hpt domain-containing protein n=2 Tax=Luteimonas viscosa TaxID=1132694 RepID=A0A5D4XSC9_9GAMM|nr:Hpt domain-containing protein [Luteimonas viscosa]
MPSPAPTTSPDTTPTPVAAAPRTPVPPPSAPSGARAPSPAPASVVPHPPQQPPAVAPEAPKRQLAAVLDTEILDDLQAMLGEEVDRLVDIFLDDTPRLIRALENAASGPDYDALRDAAHSLKSSSANLGALSLSAAAKRVELAAREKSLERPAVAVALIANEFARAKQQLLARRPAQQA